MSDTTLQQQLLDELAPFIRSGRISVHGSDKPWFGLIRQRYPVSISGIDWKSVPDAHADFSAMPSFIPDEGIGGAVLVRHHASEIRAFLTQFSESADIGLDDCVIVIGDEVTDVALEMSFNVLLETFPTLFAYPHHVCGLRSDASWCFLFKFERDMHYGESPSASEQLFLTLLAPAHRHRSASLPDKSGPRRLK